MSPLKVTNPVMVDPNAKNLKNLPDQGFKKMLVSMFEISKKTEVYSKRTKRDEQYKPI